MPKTHAQSFNKNAGIPSRPVVILGLIFFKVAITSTSSNSRKRTVEILILRSHDNLSEKLGEGV